MSDVVLYEVRDRVAIVTLNRPDRLNAWTTQMGNDYWNRLDEAAADPEVRVIVVTGAGRGFCAGADMDLLQSIGAGGSTGEVVRDEHQSYTTTIPKPVIGAINGACAGLGLVQATMCDIRFAADDAKFTSAFGKRGLVAEYGIAWMLPRIVGHANAMDILMSARTFLAPEAKELGLVNEVFPAASLMDETMAYATEMANNVAPASMKVIKQQVMSGWEWEFHQSNADTHEKMAFSLRQTDFREGVQSYLDKRPPDFSTVSTNH